MADLDYPPVMDEEEQKRADPYAMYPPAQPRTAMAAPAISDIPAPDLGTPLQSEGPLAAPAAQPSMAVAAANTPQPKRSDYAPPEPHGWAKLGHLAASFNPETNQMFNVAPQQRAQHAYEAATKEHDTQFNEGLELTKENRAKAGEESQAELRKKQGEALAPNVMVKVPWQDEPIAMSQKGAEAYYKTQQQGATSENVADTKAKSATDVTSMKTKSAEDIARERRDSQERIATGHNLATTEAARIRAAAANDPNKLTNTMKTMKQQAQSTLPGIDRALDETEKIAAKLGPGEGRWNEFWQGKVGAADPEFAHYKDEISLVSTAVTLAHARGRMSNELYEHFQKMFDVGKQAPENMIQALNVAKEWLTEYANMGNEPPAATPPKGAPPKPGTVEKGYRFKGGDPADKKNWEKAA